MTHYFNRVFSGDGLRKALEADEDFKKLFSEKYGDFCERFGITDFDKKNYLISTKEDCQILYKIKELKGKNLLKEDEKILELVESQLKADWRNPLIKFLDNLLEKY